MSHQLIVAIGRESGSGGLDIAHALAERLQLPLFDKSILQKAAEDKGVSAQTLERYDERPYSPLFCRSVRGISSAPEDCVAQMQFELLRQLPGSYMWTSPVNPSWYWAAALKRCWRTGKG